MKDIYELIDEIDIDENEIESMEASEFEKVKVKNYLKKSIKKTQKIDKELRDKYFIVDIPIEEVTDDLGNVYTATSILTNAGGENRYKGKSMASFGKIDPNATKLIITPKVHLSNDVHQVSGTEEGGEIDTSPIIDNNHPKNGEIVLDDIVIELEK